MVAREIMTPDELEADIRRILTGFQDGSYPASEIEISAASLMDAARETIETDMANRSGCAHCGKPIWPIGKPPSGWVHVATQTIHCHLNAEPRAY
jgi:hypothetical protein